LSFAVWCWVFDIQPHDQYTLPYSAQSPISKKVKDFNTINDIWEEVHEIAKSDHKYSIGQQLYYLLPLFANPHYITDYHIPLGTTLDDTDALKLSMFSIIKNEMALALKHKAEKNDNSKS